MASDDNNPFLDQRLLFPDPKLGLQWNLDRLGTCVGNAIIELEDYSLEND
ncbi:hypothetical protein ACFLXA_04530 [Chloroflexota bacterium]